MKTTVILAAGAGAAVCCEGLIRSVHNPDCAESASMYSLCCARDVIWQLCAAGVSRAQFQPRNARRALRASSLIMPW